MAWTFAVTCTPTLYHFCYWILRAKRDPAGIYDSRYFVQENENSDDVWFNTADELRRCRVHCERRAVKTQQRRLWRRSKSCVISSSSILSTVQRPQQKSASYNYCVYQQCSVAAECCTAPTIYCTARCRRLLLHSFAIDVRSGLSISRRTRQTICLSSKCL